MKSSLSGSYRWNFAIRSVISAVLIISRLTIVTETFTVVPSPILAGLQGRSAFAAPLYETRRHHRPIKRSSPMLTRAQKGVDAPNDDDDVVSADSSSRGWLLTVVLPLWLVFVSNIWNRSSVYYLVNFDVSNSDAFTAMNVDIGFSEAQYGILASLAFTSLYAFATLGAGWASDRSNRKTLTIVSAVCWSVATLGTAAADSYEAILACRVAMGLACAFSAPTAYTLIRDNVPQAQTATATSFYGTAVALGSGLASLTILLDSAVGWRQALTIIAATGFASAAACFTILPNDDKTKGADPSIENSTDEIPVKIEGFESILADVQGSFSTTRAQWIFLGSFLRFCSGLCIGVWGAPYFRMTFDDRTADFSVAQAAISAVGASCSGVLGGTIADKLSFSSGATADEDGKKDLVGRRLWVPVVGSILAAPTWYLAMHSSDSFEVAMAWLAAEYFVAECWFGPTISTLQATVGPKIGGTAQGLFTMTGAVANLAPTVLGFLYGQAVAGNDGSSDSTSEELSSLLSAAVCFGYLSSAFCFGMAAQSAPPLQDENVKALKQL